MKNSNITFSSFNPFRSVRVAISTSCCLLLALCFASRDHLFPSENETSKTDYPVQNEPKKMTEKWTYDEIAKKLIFQYCEQPEDHTIPGGTRVSLQWTWPEIKVKI